MGKTLGLFEKSTLLLGLIELADPGLGVITACIIHG